MKLEQPKKINVRYLVIFFLCIAGLFSIVGSGSRYIHKGSPTLQASTNDFFVANISPQCPFKCESFLLTIENKTDKNIELDWNKTLYISGGQTSGGFMFEGNIFADRNDLKPPDIIFPGITFSKTIFPNNLVEFRSGSWGHENMPLGENGIYLTVRVSGQEINEKILINIIEQEVKR